ncbi:MAG: hypothetical protein O2781_02925, partial [Bacteroidetes bacterium]|nr:hypothetical protein [Bacteroidota bacterium]
EKFEKNNKRREDSSPSITERNSNGSNMFFIEPIALLLGGNIGVGYEHFSKSGRSSISIPLRIQVTDSYTYDSYGLLSIGFKHKFFPTGSDGVVRGFLGYAENLGSISLYHDYFFNETQFIGGVQFHPSQLINITLDAGIGLGLLDFDETYLSWDASLRLGFRF